MPSIGGITRMDWPAYSLDLNPITHVWDMLGRRIAARQPPSTCLPELRMAMLDEWCNIPQDQIDKLILSMPRRWKSVFMLDETKQLQCGYVTVGCRRVRRTDVVDRLYLCAPFHESGLSTRRPLFGLHLTQNHRRLRRQCCDERRMWAAEWNEVVFNNESHICLQHHDVRIRVWRHRGQRIRNGCIMHRHTDPASSIMIELPPCPARYLDLSPIENMGSMIVQRLTQITPPAITPDQLWQRVEAALSAVPQEHIQILFESMPRRVAAVITDNDGYSEY
ncbi:transposable element Tcb1 transposase [Trichonephila clavipes]|uniref:Transposable element Tcb1 transposase n=1 Tax=Trichonephila clavipes TaxID=2585209 RepID=A0A8X6VVF7_TRICX|nr:transposable element Tcb1 transposase [Trichonephila clavipes]